MQTRTFKNDEINKEMLVCGRMLNSLRKKIRFNVVSLDFHIWRRNELLLSFKVSTEYGGDME